MPTRSWGDSRFLVTKEQDFRLDQGWVGSSNSLFSFSSQTSPHKYLPHPFLPSNMQSVPWYVRLGGRGCRLEHQTALGPGRIVSTLAPGEKCMLGRQGKSRAYKGCRGLRNFSKSLNCTGVCHLPWRLVGVLRVRISGEAPISYFSFPSLQVKILLCNPYLGDPPHLSGFCPEGSIGSF